MGPEDRHHSPMLGMWFSKGGVYVINFFIFVAFLLEILHPRTRSQDFRQKQTNTRSDFERTRSRIVQAKPRRGTSSLHPTTSSPQNLRTWANNEYGTVRRDPVCPIILNDNEFCSWILACFMTSARSHPAKDTAILYKNNKKIRGQLSRKISACLHQNE